MTISGPTSIGNYVRVTIDGEFWYQWFNLTVSVPAALTHGDAGVMLTQFAVLDQNVEFNFTGELSDAWESNSRSITLHRADGEIFRVPGPGSMDTSNSRRGFYAWVPSNLDALRTFLAGSAGSYDITVSDEAPLPLAGVASFELPDEGFDSIGRLGPLKIRGVAGFDLPEAGFDAVGRIEPPPLIGVASFDLSDEFNAVGRVVPVLRGRAGFGLPNLIFDAVGKRVAAALTGGIADFTLNAELTVEPMIGAPDIAWLMEVQANTGETYRFWSRAGTLELDANDDGTAEEWAGAAGIVSVSAVQIASDVEDSRLQVAVDVGGSIVLRTLLLQDIGPAPVRVYWIFDRGKGWEISAFRIVGVLSAPEIAGAVATFEIETIAGQVDVRNLRMWSHSDQLRRDPTDYGFEYMRDFERERVMGSWPPRRE